MPITAAPAAPPARKTPQTPKIPVKSKTSEREEAINGFGQIGQGILIAVRQFADAGTIGLHWGNISREVALLAEKEEKIARLVDPLLQVGPYAGLLSAVLPMAMQFAVNHGRVQAGTLGTVSPVVIESQIKTRIAQLELDARKAQKQAEADLKRLDAELAGQN